MELILVFRLYLKTSGIQELLVPSVYLQCTCPSGIFGILGDLALFSYFSDLVSSTTLVPFEYILYLSCLGIFDSFTVRYHWWE